MSREISVYVSYDEGREKIVYKGGVRVCEGIRVYGVCRGVCIRKEQSVHRSVVWSIRRKKHVCSDDGYKEREDCI